MNSVKENIALAFYKYAELSCCSRRKADAAHSAVVIDTVMGSSTHMNPGGKAHLSFNREARRGVSTMYCIVLSLICLTSSLYLI